MLLSLAAMIPAWAFLGAFARMDVVGPGGVLGGLVVGAAVGLFFGLVFGGARRRWVDSVFGSEDWRRVDTAESQLRQPARSEGCC
jgi:hypothetical protein